MLLTGKPNTRWDARDIAYFESQPKKQIALRGRAPFMEAYIMQAMKNISLVRITEPGVHQYEVAYIDNRNIIEITQ